jgi:C4-dicarboxylate-specific signal transduction histidine kinase
MTVSKKEIAKILKLAAKQSEAADKKRLDAEAEAQDLRNKLAEMQKTARARAIATRLIVGDDVRRDIDERTSKLASQDMDVVEKALELGKTEAVLKLGEALAASNNSGNNTGRNPLLDVLVTLI